MESKPIIAVVQDDLLYQTLTQKILQASGFPNEILLFNNGLFMISYLQEHKEDSQKLPDIILLDMNMPVMDGWTFLEEYEKLSPLLNKNSSIFIHTSSLYIEDLDKVKGYSSVTGSIPKPLRINTVKQLFEKQMAVKKEEKNLI